MRLLILGALTWSGVALGAATVTAADFPTRPVRFIVGFASGGTTDVLARLVGRRLSEKWGQPVVVEIKPGADGSIATEYVSRSPADGYIIGWVTSSHAITPITTKLNYDPINGIAPITLATSNPSLLVVNPAVPARSVKELIALAKSKPDELRYASAGTNTIQNLQMLLFMQMAGIQALHVPYKGGGQAITALLGGEVDLYFAGVSTAAAQVSAGQLRALGVGSSARTTFDPNMPTIAEAGGLPGFDASNWTGALTAPGTPKDILKKLHDDIVYVIRVPEMQKRLTDLGFVTIASTPEGFAEIIKRDITRWSGLLKAVAEK